MKGCDLRDIKAIAAISLPPLWTATERWPLSSFQAGISCKAWPHWLWAGRCSHGPSPRSGSQILGEAVHHPLVLRVSSWLQRNKKGLGSLRFRDFLSQLLLKWKYSKGLNRHDNRMPQLFLKWVPDQKKMGKDFGSWGNSNKGWLVDQVESLGYDCGCVWFCRGMRSFLGDVCQQIFRSEVSQNVCYSLTSGLVRYVYTEKYHKENVSVLTERGNILYLPPGGWQAGCFFLEGRICQQGVWKGCLSGRDGGRSKHCRRPTPTQSRFILPSMWRSARESSADLRQSGKKNKLYSFPECYSFTEAFHCAAPWKQASIVRAQV